MKHRILSLSVFPWLLGLSSPVLAIPTIQHWETSNGAQVYFVPALDIPIVDVDVTFDAGSARDADKPGVAAFTNNLLEEGAGDLTADQIAEKFDNLGATFSHTAGRDMGSVTLRSLSDPALLQPALELVALLLTKPTFEQTPLERIRDQMLASLKYQEQSPDSIADNHFYRAIYGKHPYAISSEGTKESVAALTKDDAKAFLARYYVGKNVVVAIVGALDRPKAEQVAMTVVGSLPAGEAAPPLPSVPNLTQPQTTHITHPTTQTHILMGQPGIAWNEPDYFPLYVGNYILGGSGFASLILNEVREKRGLAYSAYCYFSQQRVPGPFIAGLQTRNDQTAEAITVVQTVLREFLEKGPTEDKLKSAKQGITGGFPLRIKSNSNILDYLSLIGFYHLPLDYLHTFNQNIEAVTQEKIKETLNRHLQLDKWVTVTVGEESKGLREEIAREVFNG